MRHLFSVLAAVVCVSLHAGKLPDASTLFSARAPGTVFLNGEPLLFDLKQSAPAPGRWILRSWHGSILESGNIAGGEKVLKLPPLSNGYYLLEAETRDGIPFPGNRSFAVVPVPDINPDGFFALDTALSWRAVVDRNNPRQPENVAPPLAELCRRAGVSMARERMRWREVEPRPEQFDWKSYLKNASLLADRGIAVSGMYHDAPEWAKTNTKTLPGDLLALFRFNRQVSRVFQGKMSVWEFWNEQDLAFSTESAWDYAAALKAAYLGFKAGNPGVLVAPGGIAVTSLKNYNYVVMENGAAEYFDIFNMHTYQPLCDYPALLRNIHRFREKYNLLDHPLWFTESGSHAEGSGREKSFLKGIRAHSFEQELIVAEYIPKMMLYMQSLGVDRDFCFILPPFNERSGTKDWGFMRRDYTVKPAYAALANLASGLGHASFAGTLDPAPGVRGFLYRQPDGSCSLACFSISELDLEPNSPDRKLTDLKKRSFQLSVPDGSYRCYDIFGTPSSLTATGGQLTVSATRFVTRIDGLPPIRPDKPFVSRNQRNQRRARRTEMDRTVVFRVELSKDFDLSVDRDCADVRKNAAAFKLQIYNFSPDEKTGTLTFSGGKILGNPATLQLPAFGKIELPLKFTPEWNHQSRGELRIEGVFNGRKSSPLVAPLVNFSKLISSSKQKPLSGSSNPASWRKNSSGTMKITFDSGESAIRFDVRFAPHVDRWVYPEYTLQLPQESLEGSSGIAFEIKAAAPEKIRQMLVMAVKGPERIFGKPLYLKVQNPSEEWQERVIWFHSAGIDPAGLKKLRIGFNPTSDHFVYWLRNIRILYSENGER